MPPILSAFFVPVYEIYLPLSCSVAETPERFALWTLAARNKGVFIAKTNANQFTTGRDRARNA